MDYNTFPDLFGNRTSSQKIALETNHYFPVRSFTDLMVTRFYAGIGLDDRGLYFEIGEAF